MQNPLPSNAPTLSLISTTEVPPEWPTTTTASYRLAVIGEAPGETEENYRRPFVGASGRLLDSILASSGVARSACYIGNVCRYRPPGNDIKAFGWEDSRVLAGVAALEADLKTFQPNCVLLLGNTPLYFATGKTGVTSWRGSILESKWGKAIPSLHPAAVLREYKDWPLLRFDVMRARAEAETPTITLPQRNLELDLTANEICHRLDNWPAGQLLSFDIEGGLDAFPCCSVAGETNRGFIIAWSRHSPDDQGRIAQSLSRALYSVAIPKVLQNSLYDRFVLAYGYNMLIRGVREDTMLKQWEVYPELPKGLGTIASIWTREPYYKFEGGRGNKGLIPANDHSAIDTYHRYCIKDSCVTLEACLAQDGALSGDGLRHYRFNVDLLSPLLYMELRGIRYDAAGAAASLAEVRASLSETSNRLALRAGYSLTGAKGSISSTKLKKFLYTEKGYPEQKKGRGPDAKSSTDVEALLNLQKKYSNDPILEDVLLHRKLESIAETLEVSTDSDGRVRCGYNLVGTETGRLTCYTSPTGSGANLQTITKKLRKLYRADDGYFFFQCDLSGADGWTVAAHCLRHGDPTMWDDYQYGLKPARIIALMYEHGPSIALCSREELKERCKLVDDDGWLYFACKAVQHGSNYGMQERTMSVNIMKQSYKKAGRAIHVTPKDCATLQRLYFVRYPGIYQWHEWAKREVEEGRNLKGASGHTRTFFGRRKSYNQKRKSYEADHETWKEFLSDEPQSNTTYATNLALHRLWHDPENRVDSSTDSRVLSGSKLLIEPLHQVHDALCGQFPITHTDFAVRKLREWFNNPLKIANVELVIPFEGNYGPSWGELGSKYGGGEI